MSKSAVWSKWMTSAKIDLAGHEHQQHAVTKLASANDRSWISAKYLEAASRCWWPDGRWEVPTIFWSRTRHNRQAKTRKAAYCKLLVLGWCFRWQVYLSIEACRAVKLSKLLPGSVRGFRPWCWRLSSSFPSGWPDVMCIRYHSVKFKKKREKKDCKRSTKPSWRGTRASTRMAKHHCAESPFMFAGGAFEVWTLLRIYVISSIYSILTSCLYYFSLYGCCIL